MALDGLVDRLDATSTTRRTVVKTGAKLAYAAPLVAASFKLSTASGLAVSPNGACNTFQCGNLDPCADRPDASPQHCWCFEVAATPGEGRCLGNFYCSPDLTTPCPNGQSDCPSGTTCVTNTCCGGGIQYCAPSCPDEVVANGLTEAIRAIPNAAGV